MICAGEALGAVVGTAVGTGVEVKAGVAVVVGGTGLVSAPPARASAGAPSETAVTVRLAANMAASTCGRIVNIGFLVALVPWSSRSRAAANLAVFDDFAADGCRAGAAGSTGVRLPL